MAAAAEPCVRAEGAALRATPVPSVSAAKGCSSAVGQHSPTAHAKSEASDASADASGVV